MGNLTNQVQKLASGYMRKGGKINRRQQAARMIAFASHAEALGAREMGQVGAKHVMAYYRAQNALSYSTRYNHYRAIVLLWDLAGKTGVPPAPFKPSSTMTETEPLTTAKPVLGCVHDFEGSGG